MLFNRNTVTGTVRAFNRRLDDDALFVTLQLQSGTITLMVMGDLADQIERVLFERRRQRVAVVLSLEYDPATAEIVSFSVIS